MKDALDQVDRLLRVVMHPLLLVRWLETANALDRVDCSRRLFLVDDIAVLVPSVNHLPADLYPLELPNWLITIFLECVVDEVSILRLDVVEDLVECFRSSFLRLSCILL